MRTRLLLVSLAVFPPLIFHASGATLSGRVVDDHAGSAVASADVRVFKIGVRAVAAELETDGEGRFHAEGLPDGEYRIEVSKPNHINSSLRTNLSAATPSNLLLRLVRCGAISGRILKSSGQPVRGATVFALRQVAGGLRRELANGMYSLVDGEGRFRLYNLAPGQYVVSAAYGYSALGMGMTGSGAAAPGVGSGVQYYPSNLRPQPFTITSGETFQNIDLSVFSTNLYAVSGRVDPAGETKLKGRYWLALTLAEQPAIAVAATIAKDDGSFQFDGIAPGSYHLFVSGPSQARGPLGAEVKEGGLFGRTRVTIGSQNVDNLVLSPQKALTVPFVLRAPAGGCTSAGQMILTSLEDWGANLERRSPLSFNDPQLITRLAPARYRVAVTGLGETCYVPDGTLVDLSAARDGSPVAITAVRAGSIHGVVSPARPASGITVVLVDVTDPSQPVQVAMLDAESKFTFGSLRPGRYRLSAKMPNGPSPRWTDQSAPGVDVEVTGGDPVRLTIPEPKLP